MASAMRGTQPSIRHTAVNAIDATGRTQLARASFWTPRSTLPLRTTPVSPLEYAEKFKHVNCAALVRNEANYRVKDPSNDFVTNLRAELTVADGADFDERLFRQAVENDPAAAAKYLDQFVSSGRYDYSFTQLDAICGRKNVKSSALYSVLNDSIVDDGGAKHDLLQHVVLQRVLDVKWELFSARKYYQQLLMHLLVLGAMTRRSHSTFGCGPPSSRRGPSKRVTANDTTKVGKLEAEYVKKLSLQTSAVVWLFSVVFCLVGFVHLRQLKPERLLKLVRWMYDGKHVLDPSFAIPHVAKYKAKVRSWLLVRTILWTLVLAVPLLVVTYTLDVDGQIAVLQYQSFAAFGILLITAAYFLVLEYLELLGEDPWIFECIEDANVLGKLYWSFVLVFLLPFIVPFKASYRKYFASFTNKLQLTTYLWILGPFALLHAMENIVGYPFELTVTLAEFLEVNKTAGYLLPIVKDVMGDVWDFLIFYGVFQCGLTCAYYFIFQQKSDAYKTLWASFRATYFVMYGENGVGDFNAKDDTTKEHLLQGPIMHFGFILRMFHCAVMVVLLLNLLLAMMNKTVDRNWAKLQSRALASYARCVLRLETMLGHTEAAREKRLQILTPAGPVLNPIFGEHVSKRQLTMSTAKDDIDEDTRRDGLLTKVHDLSIQNAQLETQIAGTTQRLDSQLHDVLAAIQRAAK
ncbi:hypothetical protein SPRG_12094 [Saprolegnia parasitica CBS 223.65]|uniref:Uncharacterized protein n=1 Tax=Saprolegnia parasitica (strain CBS 223.65) TaxID=695850 RepID=A0A067C6V0_SAPPC|nr:hypothetical protein SPRG_12094 [Saprolegnia parasitica CBS 223.65]KDO22256.1 hypothetical protein SPRG_12094 [Saprolegnia parasitica CBS 223.65]|eukprot:XP_012206992.1 hypothetical protein SPRG_12094 [Saprolegnia parasitica CBS 223.65]